MKTQEALAEKWSQKLPESFALVKPHLGKEFTELPESLRSSYIIDINGLIRRRAPVEKFVPLRIHRGLLEIHPTAYEADEEKELVVIQIKVAPGFKAELLEAASLLTERRGRVVHMAEILRAGAREHMKQIRKRDAA